MSGKPTPGSDEAAAIGCRCARMDNGYGHHPYMGWNEDGTGNWSIRGDCPIHGFSHDLDIDGRYPWDSVALRETITHSDGDV